MLRRHRRQGRSIPLLLVVGLFAGWLFALPGTFASAKTTITVQVGWGNKFRPGRWTPLYVTLHDSTQRQAVIEAYAPTDRRYAMRIRQQVAIGPTPITVPLYVPLSYELNETVVAVHDLTNNSFKRLESTILSDYPAYNNGMGGPEGVSSQQLFIGISGNAGTERVLQTQLTHPNISTSYLAPAFLPTAAIGYDMLDALVLSQPDLARIAPEQQQAIVDWVRGGGILILWPGTGPVPADSPIAQILPASIGETRVYTLDPAAVSKADLPGRFAKLTGRALTSTSRDSKSIAIFGTGAESPVGQRRWVGFGQVVLFPADLATLQFNGGQSKSLAFWRTALAGVVAIPELKDNNNPNYYYGMADPSRAASLRQAMDWISDIPGAGQFGFSYVAGVLLVMMVVVGPVDWFVLKRMGRQPWTWVTITGWIALVTLGAIYIGHVFKSGEVFFRTASVLDEVGGSRVAAVDVAGIYSPQTTGYDFQPERESWWRPASEVNPYGASGLQLELGFHQDYRGNRPTPMVINVWNMRFLEGTDQTVAPPVIDAKLKRDGGGNRISGTIRNAGDAALSSLRVRTGRGVATIYEKLEPGATREIDVPLDGGDKTLAATRPNPQDPWMYRHQNIPTTLPTALTLNGVSDRRSQRIDQILVDRADVACVYAEYETTAPPARLKLDVVNPNATHRGVVRALVPLE